MDTRYIYEAPETNSNKDKLAGKLIASNGLRKTLIYDIRRTAIDNNFICNGNTNELINMALVNLLYELKNEPQDEKESLIIGLKTDSLNYLKDKINEAMD